MNVPDEPSNTCPKIDNVLKIVHEKIARHHLECGRIERLMEEIRDANADLRTRAQFFEQLYGEKDSELDKMTDERDELEKEIKDLKKELGTYCHV